MVYFNKQADEGCFAAAGLVTLVYDHILTLPDEIALIWAAPSSFSKHVFLLNRYIVPSALASVAFGTSGVWKAYRGSDY